MKIKIFKIALLLILLICFISFFMIHSPSKNKSFDDLLGTKAINITKVLIVNGKNGNSIAIKDRAKINELTQLFNNRAFSESSNQEPSTGFTYSISFYVTNFITSNITYMGENSLTSNRFHYNIDKAVSKNELDGLFESFPVTKFPNTAK